MVDRVSKTAKPKSGGRARPISAVRTDELVFDAGLNLLAKSGVDQTNPAAVAREAGLSITAVRSRFKSEDDFLFLIWESICLPQFIYPLFDLFEEYLEGNFSKTKEAPKALKDILKHSKPALATLEILVVSSRSSNLQKNIRNNLLQKFKPESETSDLEIAQRVTMFMILTGLLARLRVSKSNLNELADLTHNYLLNVTKPGKFKPMPNVDASHMDIYPFNTKDKIKNLLLDSCLRNIATYGFGSLTTRTIADYAQVSEGLLFSKFNSKFELVMEAFSEQLRLGFRDNLKFIKNLEEVFGSTMASAIFIRESARPGRENQRSVLLEQLRLSWHSSEVRKIQEVESLRIIKEVATEQNVKALAEQTETQAESQMRFGIPIGAVFATIAYADTWKLPFSAITETLFD